MKGLVQKSISYCVKEQKPCVGWVNRYFKDCLCNFRDDSSFALGLVSLLCWGVAEIPQIVTNFRTKSSHGISPLFLFTWVAGDIFNLFGCLLEPATLPTQFYTALLYSTTTVLLVLQSLYYDHIYGWWKSRRNSTSRQESHEDLKKPLRPHKQRQRSTDSGIPIPTAATKTPQRRDYYYTSARSLAGSATPPIRSSIWPVRSGPSAIGLEDGSSSEDEATQSATSRPILPRSAGYGAFVATSMSMPTQTKAMMQASIGFSGRKLLQEHGMGSNAVGQWLGWMMAAIYMGGRLPQIWLNIKRGSVEGLNPLMFIFALIANAAYVGSILVRNTEWDKIKANMPWLLDAVACVLLDLFIILQYVYYKYLRNRDDRGHDYLVEANKE
ncbi:vacuolar lysine transporter YPQ1-like isoform X1 [Coffea arabica]|uniref:Vacuolar lysine transporter YPQ1-like isoform X1 n=1 Tax=Coffea arabica TaxID=13443 RepID=A0A6P6TI23_COFAR|nr:lysosomal amino acid transporter 1 homolog isoform X1 [Coffea arabica]